MTHNPKQPSNVLHPLPAARSWIPIQQQSSPPPPRRGPRRGGPPANQTNLRSALPSPTSVSSVLASRSWQSNVAPAGGGGRLAPISPAAPPRFIVSPRPSWPMSLVPQHLTEPPTCVPITPQRPHHATSTLALPSFAGNQSPPLAVAMPRTPTPHQHPPHCPALSPICAHGHRQSPNLLPSSSPRT